MLPPIDDAHKPPFHQFRPPDRGDALGFPDRLARRRASSLLPLREKVADEVGRMRGRRGSADDGEPG
jgi:hypothetical protein